MFYLTPGQTKRNGFYALHHKLHKTIKLLFQRLEQFKIRRVLSVILTNTLRTGGI